MLGGVVALATAAVIVVAPSLDTSSGPGPTLSKARTGADRALTKRLAKSLPLQRKVRCGKLRRGRAKCRWRAARRLTPNRTRSCRGRAVARKRGRWRVRLSRRRCSLKVAALQPRLGFNDNSVRARQASPEQAAQLAEGVGAGLSRVTLDWRWAEPQRNVYDFRDYDRIYRASLARGVRPVFILLFAPPWATDLTLCRNDCRLPPARRAYGEWREFAGMVARRYPKAAALEVWNEPNVRAFWQSGPNPARYAELLGEAYAGIKAANPRMPVVSGGIAWVAESHDGNVSLGEFLTGVLRSRGGASADAIGIHAYAPSGELNILGQIMDQTRAARDAAGLRHKPVWITETGLTTTGAGDLMYADEATQARQVADTWRELTGRPDVQAVLFHTLIDPGGDPANPESGFGLLRSDLSPKPAYCALARVTGAGRPRGCAS